MNAQLMVERWAGGKSRVNGERKCPTITKSLPPTALSIYGPLAQGLWSFLTGFWQFESQSKLKPEQLLHISSNQQSELMGGLLSLDWDRTGLRLASGPWLLRLVLV